MCPLGHVELFKISRSISVVKQRLAWLCSNVGCSTIDGVNGTLILKITPMLKRILSRVYHLNFNTFKIIQLIQFNSIQFN